MCARERVRLCVCASVCASVYTCVFGAREYLRLQSLVIFLSIFVQHFKATFGFIIAFDCSCSIGNREERVDAVSAEIEKNLELVGATAIEDKLQDGVVHT